LLLVTVPLAAAAIIALCVAYMVDVLGGAQDSNASVMSALAAGVVIVVVAVASLFTIAVARSVLQPLHRLQMGAAELTGARLADAIRSAS